MKTKVPAHRGRVVVSEDTLLDRLEALQQHLRFPLDVWGMMIDYIAPDMTEEPAKLPKPTRTIPGTEARLRVLIERAERGEQLSHPDDTQADSADLDRLAILAGHGRNGSDKRMGQPIMQRTPSGEWIDVTEEIAKRDRDRDREYGKPKKRSKPKKAEQASKWKQLTLWGEGA